MISEKLKGVILKTLDLDAFELTEQTQAGEVPGWDSLSHIRIIIAVERDFGVRFKTMEVLPLKNVGDLQALVDKKIAGP